jgi:hypothetical protein
MWKIKSTEYIRKNQYIYISRRHMMISVSVGNVTDWIAKQDFMSKEMSQDFWEGKATRQAM